MRSQWQHLRPLVHQGKSGISGSSFKVVVSYVDCLVGKWISSSSSSSQLAEAKVVVLQEVIAIIVSSVYPHLY